MLKFAQELKQTISTKLWNITDENLQKHIQSIINNDLLFNKIFGSNNKKIQFIYFEDSINAYVKKISKNSYEIGISKELILLLLNHSFVVFEKYNFFQEVQNNKMLLEKARSSLFYFWLEIIFLHEMAHFFRKHLDIEKIKTFNEFHISQTKDEIKSDRFYYEIDADRYAGKLYAGVFHLVLKNLQTNLPFTEKVLIEKYIIDSVLYLFDFLYLIDKSDNVKQYITHPHPKQRITFFLTGISEAKYDKNIFNISLNDLEKLIDKKHLEFIDKFYIDEDFSMYIEQNKLFDLYQKFLEEKGLI